MRPGGSEWPVPDPHDKQGAGTVMAKGLAGVDTHSPCGGADRLLREEPFHPWVLRRRLTDRQMRQTRG